MDRKARTFTTDIAGLLSETRELKVTQFSGSDTTRLRILGSPNVSDDSYALPGSNGRVEFNATFDFIANLEPWQPSAYAYIFFQLFYNNTSTPYDGRANSPLNLLQQSNFSSDTNEQVQFQVVNTSGSPINVYVKYYIVTTALGGSLLFNHTAL